MNAEHNDKACNKSINEIELEAATNASFDAWTQGARDFFKGARKLIEDLDDRNSIILSDIFGKDEVTKHSHKLEEEAKREADAGHLEAANHFKRRNLNYSRSTLGENDNYTLDLSLALRSPQEVERDDNFLKMLSVSHPTERFNELLDAQLNRHQ